MKKYILFLLFLFSVTLVAQKNSYSKEEVDLKLELQQKDIDAKIKDSDHSFDKLSDKIENQNNLIAKQDNRIVDVRDNFNFFITVTSGIIGVAGIATGVAVYFFNKDNKNRLEEVEKDFKQLKENIQTQIELIKEKAKLESDRAKLEISRASEEMDEILTSAKKKKTELDDISKSITEELNKDKSAAENNHLKEKIERTVKEVSSVKNESEFTFYDWFLKGYSADENSQYELACEYYEKAIQSNLNNIPQTDIASAYNNWGKALNDLALVKKDKVKEELLLQATEKYIKATEIDQKYDKGYYNWGNALYNLAEIKEKKEKEELLLQATEKYIKAAEINPKNDDTYNNWGLTLYNLALLKKDKVKEELLLQALEEYKIATEINPKNENVLYNWAIALSNLAEVKKDKEKKELLSQALEKYKIVTEINPKNENASYNWAIALYNLSQLKENEEKEETLLQALEKYKITTEINPKNNNAYSGWGYTLLILATEKNTLNENKKEIERILLKAEEIKEGSGAYNIACLYSLLNENIETAFKWFETALNKSEITREHIEQDSDLNNIREDARYKELLDKYRPQNKPK